MPDKTPVPDNESDEQAEFAFDPTLSEDQDVVPRDLVVSSGGFAGWHITGEDFEGTSAGANIRLLELSPDPGSQHKWNFLPGARLPHSMSRCVIEYTGPVGRNDGRRLGVAPGRIGFRFPVQFNRIFVSPNEFIISALDYGNLSIRIPFTLYTATVADSQNQELRHGVFFQSPGEALIPGAEMARFLQ